MVHKTVIKARYAETDQMGVIHHSVYPIWFEEARTQFIKESGITYGQFERDGVMMPVTDLTVKYIQPAHFEDEVTVETRITRVSYSRIFFSYRVMLGDKVLTIGTTSHGFVSSDTFKPVNIKKTFPQFFEQVSSFVEE